MISDNSVKDQSLEFISEDFLSYLSTLSPQKLNENYSDFSSPLHNVDFLQSVDLYNQAMYEGNKATPLEFSIDTNKALLAEAECSSAAAQEVQLLSRQSSLTEEWFGNISNTHPIDISVDSSLEALFASSEWQDFKVDVPPAADAAVTENCFGASSSVFQSVDNELLAEETVASGALSASSAVCKTEPVDVSENVGKCSSQCVAGILCVHFLLLCFSSVTVW